VLYFARPKVSVFIRWSSHDGLDFAETHSISTWYVAMVIFLLLLYKHGHAL
jgi:hypothetical protein